jgi:hypothetical protein
VRVSTTTLQSFTLFMEPEQEWMDEQELIASIMGDFKGTPKTDRGAAFGRALTEPDRWDVVGRAISDDGDIDWHMKVPVQDPDRGEPVTEWVYFPVDLILDCQRYVPANLTYEVKATKDYDGVTVVSKVDGIVGLRIVEFKVTDHFDFDRYATSVQWPFYLDAFDAEQVDYVVFQLSDTKRDGLQLHSVHPFTFYRWPGLQAKCRETVASFVDYLHRRGLYERAKARPTYAKK